MSRFAPIDLSQLTPPDIVETLSFATVLAALKADLIARDATLEATLDLESEPLTKLLEVSAYRETLLRARVNDAARSIMLAYASGTDLEHLAAFYGVTRLVIQEADPEATPPVAEILESDTALRARVQTAPEAFSVAGPTGAYQFLALSADPDVAAVSVDSPYPGAVFVTVQSKTGDGTASPELVETVRAVLTADDARPLTDGVVVQGVTVQSYAVTAALEIYEGPDPAVVLAEATAAVQALVTATHAPGQDLTLAALIAAMKVGGVYDVHISSPASNLVVNPSTCLYCTGVTLTEATA
jgi:phage-related baseplate assembly protein